MSDDYHVEDCFCQGGWLSPECLASLKDKLSAAEQRAADAEAVIAQHNLCHDGHGKVSCEDFAKGCEAEIEREYGVNPWLQGRQESERKIQQLTERAEKAEKFKTWVHNYLDSKGIPEQIDDAHLANGCRIGGRMDYVFEQIRQLTAACAEMREALGRVQNICVDMLEDQDNCLADWKRVYELVLSAKGTAGQSLLDELEHARQELSAAKDENAALLRQWNELDQRNEKRHREWNAEMVDLKAELENEKEAHRLTYNKVVRLKAHIDAMEEKNFWGWMNDGNDHPESIVCPIVIQADDMREIQAELNQLREQLKELHEARQFDVEDPSLSDKWTILAIRILSYLEIDRVADGLDAERHDADQANKKLREQRDRLRHILSTNPTNEAVMLALAALSPAPEGE